MGQLVNFLGEEERGKVYNFRDKSKILSVNIYTHTFFKG